MSLRNLEGWIRQRALWHFEGVISHMLVLDMTLKETFMILYAIQVFRPFCVLGNLCPPVNVYNALYVINYILFT